MDSKTILVIEDDKFLSLIMKGRLEKEGFTVLQAFDGEEGLEKIRASKPDVILLDLILPTLSGFEVLEAVSSDPYMRKIPVLIASNLGQESDIQKAKQLGVVDYYVKAKTPVDIIAQMAKNIATQGGGQGVTSAT